MFKTILLPFDGSDLADHALQYASALARVTTAQFVLAYAPAPWELAIDAPARIHWANAELRQAGIAATARVANIHADNPGRAILAIDSDVGADIIVIGAHAHGTVGHALFGSVPKRVITQLSEERETDIIVMASHGRGGVTRVLLGSVAFHGARHSAVPVLVIQPVAVTAERAETRRNASEEPPDRGQTHLGLTPDELALVRYALDLARPAASVVERTRRLVERLLPRLPSPA